MRDIRAGLRGELQLSAPVSSMSSLSRSAAACSNLNRCRGVDVCFIVSWCYVPQAQVAIAVSERGGELRRRSFALCASQYDDAGYVRFRTPLSSGRLAAHSAAVGIGWGPGAQLVTKFSDRRAYSQVPSRIPASLRFMTPLTGEGFQSNFNPFKFNILGFL